MLQACFLLLLNLIINGKASTFERTVFTIPTLLYNKKIMIIKEIRLVQMILRTYIIYILYLFNKIKQIKDYLDKGLSLIPRIV